MTEPTPSPSRRFLLVRIDTRVCGLDLAHVRETLRPLAIEPASGTPAYVAGLSIVRGAPVPVLLLGTLLGIPPVTPIRRWVSLRLGNRTAVLAVSDVVGVRSLDAAALGATPPLLGAEAADLVAEIGALDHQLLVVLRASRAVPDHVLELGGDRAAHR